MGRKKKEDTVELKEQEMSLKDMQNAIAEEFGLDVDDMSVDVELVISIDTVIEKCLNIMDGKIDKESFYIWIDENIDFNNYIDVSLKKSYIDIFYTSYTFENNDFTDLAFAFELYSKLVLMLTYTNVDFDLERVTDKEYDILMKSGFCDYVIKKIGDDYKIWIAMFERTVNMRNAFILDSFNTVVAEDVIASNTKMVKEAFENIGEDKLKYVMEIMESNDPALKKLKDTIYDASKEIIQEKESKNN